MAIVIRHLLECPQHLAEITQLIHQEWWSGKAEHSETTMAARLFKAYADGYRIMTIDTGL
jgi:hypothetical protein